MAKSVYEHLSRMSLRTMAEIAKATGVELVHVTRVVDHMAMLEGLRPPPPRIARAVDPSVSAWIAKRVEDSDSETAAAHLWRDYVAEGGRLGSTTFGRNMHAAGFKSRSNGTAHVYRLALRPR